MNRLNIFIAAGLFLLGGCSEYTPERPKDNAEPSNASVPNVKATDEIDFGTIDNSTYTNKYFGLSLQIPADWHVQDEEAKKKLVEMGNEIMMPDDPNFSRAIQASQMQTVNMLFAFQYPVGAPVSYNPGFAAAAERLSNAPGVKRGKDYLFHVRKGLERGKIKFSFPEEVTTEKIGGRDFDVLSCGMSMAGISIHQKYYAAVIKGYALVFTLAYSNDEEEAALDKILDTVKFD